MLDRIMAMDGCDSSLARAVVMIVGEVISSVSDMRVVIARRCHGLEATKDV